MNVTETKERLADMLAQNHETINSATEKAAVSEFTRVAKEYFETDGNLDFQVTRSGSGYRVTVGFRALRVKNFTTLK